MVEKINQPQQTEPQAATLASDSVVHARRLRHENETAILAQKTETTDLDTLHQLTYQHFELVEVFGQELEEAENWEEVLRIEILSRKMSMAMTGDLREEYWDPPMFELGPNQELVYPDNGTFQQLEEVYFQGVRIVKDIFEQRFTTIRMHLVEELIKTSRDDSLNLGLRALNLENSPKFFFEIVEDLRIQTGGLLPNQLQQELILKHQQEYFKQERLLQKKLKKIDRDFAQTITRSSKETINQVHKDFVAGLQDALNIFGQENQPINAPIVALLTEFKKQTEAAPGEEILKAVRKMYILSTFDKDQAGATYLTKFTLTRALVLGMIKNYWESSGGNIIDFQNKLRTWWVVHVNRPKIDQDNQVVQEISSPMLNSERGSYFTMFSLEDERLEQLRNINQKAALAILVRQQLLSTLVNQDRNQGLDILDGWTHTDMPNQEQYAVIVHQGGKYKKLFFRPNELENIDQFIESFTQQFEAPDWNNFELTKQQKEKALSGKTTIQEAQKRKFDPHDPTSADTSLVLLQTDPAVIPEDVVQRGTQSWTHGSAIKFSLTLFVNQDGLLSGKGAQKGSHAWTDGRVSTIKLENALVEASTLFEMQLSQPSSKPERLDVSKTTSGLEYIDNEQESRVQIAQFERHKYQQRVQKLFEFFKRINPPEARFTFDINGLISSAIMMTLNDIWKLSNKKRRINNIQFLERAKFVRSGVQIGDSLTPVPLQFNDGMQEDIRSLATLLKKHSSQIDSIVAQENLPANEIRNMLQRLVLSFAFFDEERRLVRGGNPGIIAVMSEMAGKIRKPLTFASGITSPDLTDMAINTVLISSLVPSRAREKSSDNNINIESFSTALDEVFNYFGFVISASSFGQGNKEKISIVVRQMKEVISPVIDNVFGAVDPSVDLQLLIEKNMERVLLVLETFQSEYEKEQLNGSH